MNINNNQEYQKWFDKQIKDYEESIANEVKPSYDWILPSGDTLTFYHLFGNEPLYSVETINKNYEEYYKKFKY